MSIHAASTNARQRAILIGCAAVLLLSSWIQARVLAGTEVDTPIRADAASYVSYAWNLREFHTFSRDRTWMTRNPTAPTPDKLTLPGYPVFLALFMDGRPDREFIAKVTTAQALLGVGTCALVLLIALRLLPLGWALIVGTLTAISPHLATINTYLLTESLFCFLFTASAYAMVRALQSPERLTWYLAGAVLLALACHVRPQLQPLPIVLLAALVVSRSVRRHWAKSLIAVFVFAALLAPWQLRNAGIERPSGDPDLLPTSLYHGSFPDFMYRENPRSFGIPYRFDPLAREHSESIGTAMEWIHSEFERDPTKMTNWYLFGKPYYFMSWSIVGGAGDIFIYPVRRSPYLEHGMLDRIRALALFMHFPLMFLALASIVTGAIRPSVLTKSSKAWAPVRILSIVLLVMILVHTIGAPFPRYGIPFRWAFYLMAVFPLAKFCELAGQRLHHRGGIVASGHDSRASAGVEQGGM